MRTKRGALKLHFTEETEKWVTLDAEVAAGYFGGRGHSLFSTAEIEAFAKAISQYPLPESARCCLEGSDDDNGLSIKVSPISSRGHLGVTVRLWTTRDGLPMKVELALVTTYQSLANFSVNLSSAVRNQTEGAILEEEAVL